MDVLGASCQWKGGGARALVEPRRSWKVFSLIFDLLSTKTATVLFENYYVLVKLSKAHSRG